MCIAATELRASKVISIAFAGPYAIINGLRLVVPKPPADSTSSSSTGCSIESMPVVISTK
ncbi:hypothetical protein CHELA1G11_21091 [Hyphomicrobiales bacterium]|nr:hypothetical protein CHELA1G11_21091 [Hyphomicrobiales bacterium]CAH1693264.1 hypothetical protein CHELA1G2_21399 [Hyphomicrobiales bacterium]